MSSSPEQSGSPLGAHTVSQASIHSVVSAGSGGDSPPHAGGAEPTNFLSPPPPTSPHLGPRPSSSGKVVGGKMRRLFRVPTSTHSVTEVALDGVDHQAKFFRMLRPMKMSRHFRRKRRSGIDKQYHSDDGYTSDPGVLRDQEEDEETDGDHEAEARRQQIQSLERKLEKARRLLLDQPQDEDEPDLATSSNAGGGGGGGGGEFMEGNNASAPDSKPHQHRFKTVLQRSHTKLRGLGVDQQQQKKKVEKLESQLRELTEGGPINDQRRNYRGAKFFRGGIEGSLRGMSLLKGKLTNAGNKLKRKRGSEVTQDEEGIEEDPDEDDEMYQDAIEEATIDDISMTVGNDPELSLTGLKEELAAVQCASSSYFEDNRKLLREVELQKENVGELETNVALLFEKLEQEKERAERLESHINDITELHQHEVEDLRAQLEQMESLTTGKNQDLEDTMEACQSRVDHLETFVHKLIDSGEPPSRRSIPRPVTEVLTAVLVVVAFLLKVFSLLRTRPGVVIGICVFVAALISYVLLF